MITVDIGGAALALLPQRAAYAPAYKTLLVADAHIGKAVSFRRLGVPVPEGTTAQTLQRLSQSLEATGAEHVIFLGDFLHSARAQRSTALAAARAWREQWPGVRLTLVRGNHDDHAGDPPPQMAMQVLDGPLPLGPWRLAHHPQPDAEGYVLAGHLHPCLTLAGRAGDSLRLPCFHFGARVGVLPAFGAFTGMHGVRRAPGDRVFVVCDDVVTPV